LDVITLLTSSNTAVTFPIYDVSSNNLSISYISACNLPDISCSINCFFILAKYLTSENKCINVLIRLPISKLLGFEVIVEAMIELVVDRI